MIPSTSVWDILSRLYSFLVVRFLCCCLPVQDRLPVHLLVLHLCIIWCNVLLTDLRECRLLLSLWVFLLVLLRLSSRVFLFRLLFCSGSVDIPAIGFFWFPSPVRGYSIPYKTRRDVQCLGD